MKIKMLRSSMGSNDGFTVKHYEKDEEYEVSESLGNSFIGERIAEMLADKESQTGPVYVEGEIYVQDEVVYVGLIPGGQSEVALMPVDQLTPELRAELISEGKLTEDGKAVEGKAMVAAPKNKAITKAPKNKAITKAPKNKAK